MVTYVLQSVVVFIYKLQYMICVSIYLSCNAKKKKIEIHTVSNNIHFTSIFVKNQYLSMIKSRVEATSVMASHQLTFSRVSDYNKTPTTKNPEKKQGGARVKGALEFEQRISGVFFSLRKHFLHVGPQVLDRILSPLPTVQILPDLIIDQNGCFGLIMDGLGQEIIKMAPHFVKKPTFFRT